ncbi:MAG: hypothetical protein J3K34DRAFT_46490 [Monoraphidium minutum]|nr:MAG: hypothetical protein J3K34DRAFT_46490 [Monoraphidium minutum]
MLPSPPCTFGFFEPRLPFLSAGLPTRACVPYAAAVCMHAAACSRSSRSGVWLAASCSEEGRRCTLHPAHRVTPLSLIQGASSLQPSNLYKGQPKKLWGCKGEVCSRHSQVEAAAGQGGVRGECRGTGEGAASQHLLSGLSRRAGRARHRIGTCRQEIAARRPLSTATVNLKSVLRPADAPRHARAGGAPRPAGPG